MCAPQQTFSHYPAWPAPVDLHLVTAPAHPCAYLPDRQAQMRAFLTRSMPPDLYRQFMDAGFRRSGNIIYQPACAGCRACVPLRIMIKDFRPSKSQRRCWRRNSNLHVAQSGTRATDEEYALYCRYVEHWHGHDDRETSREDFECFLSDTPVESIKFTYRDASNCLLAVGICDISAEALSSVYFYFDPSRHTRGLGTYGALYEIDFAARSGIEAYYLGYWVESCTSMQYKSNFRPHQVMGTDGVWRAREPANLL